MAREDTYIGIFGNFGFDYPCTVHNLRTEIRRGTKWSAKEYCDGRCATNLYRFIYDPFTGEKIDWEKVRKLLEKE